MASRAAQPFVENNKNPGEENYDGGQILADFGAWVAANGNLLAPHDVISLITDEVLDGINGIAYLGAACYGVSSMFYGTNVVYDIGRAWRGIRTLTHEIGHNIGAPHDGNGDAVACAWEAGFIMGTLSNYDLNKFVFSACSKDTIIAFLNTPRAQCLQSLQAGSHWDLGSVDPGQLYSMNQQCQLYENNPTAVVNPNIDPDTPRWAGYTGVDCMAGFQILCT